MNLPVIQKTMIEEFQCPGCVAGIDVNCKAFKLEEEEEEGWFRCDNHCPGTRIGGIGRIILGLPKGFTRVGPIESNMPKMRLWAKGSVPDWDKFNIPVWAMEKDGYLFVRTFMPRINYPFIDVIEGGELDLCPNAINVGEFYDQIG